jgi:dTDP-4-dehydrorhamnose reductase
MWFARKPITSDATHFAPPASAWRPITNQSSDLSMPKPVVLVVGGTGMLGHKLTEVLGAASELEVHAAARQLPPVEFRQQDVTYHAGIELGGGRTEIEKLLHALAPDIVVNAAGAIKHRDLASSPADTLYMNGMLPHFLAVLNPNRAARVIHFSTDCVYKGDRGRYREEEVPDAGDLYGWSKAAGEITYGPHLTLRTSIIGFELANHLGLLAWFFRQPAGASVKGYSKAIFSGLPTVTLSRTVLQIIRDFPELRGLYHVASEPITKLELIERIRAAFGLERDIIPSGEVAIDRSLDDSRFRAATRTTRPSWGPLIDDLLADYHAWPYASRLAVPLESSK